jgi:GAF domain-containing protein
LTPAEGEAPVVGVSRADINGSTTTGAANNASALSLTDIALQLDTLRQITRRLEEERDESRRRERHLQFVRELAHRSGGRTDLDSYVEFCVRGLCSLLKLDKCALLVTQSGALSPQVQAFHPPPAERPLLLSDPITAQVLEEGGEFQSDDLSQLGLDVEESALLGWHAGSLFALPLTVEDKPYGVLFLARAAAPGAFHSTDVSLAREVASEVAMAIDGALRFHSMERKARQIERSREEIRSYFHQIGAAMSSALNLNQLLRLIVNLCIRITQADAGSLYLIENHRLRQQVMVGPERGADVPAPYHVRESLMGWGENTFGTAGSAPRFRPSPDLLVPKKGGQTEIRSFLGVPLIIKDEVKGQLNIYTQNRREFTPEEVALLTAFAGQAALAIENAQIFEFESQRAREATLLYRAARAIALSTDLEEVLGVSVAQLVRITEADRCMIFLVQDRPGEFKVAHCTGLSSDQEEFFSVYRLKASHFSPEMWENFTRGRQIFLTGPPADCPSLARFFALVPTNTCLLVPLLAKENLLGLLYLDDSKMARYFDSSQIRMVMTLSIQIATAIQRARLLSQLRENLDQFKALHQVSTAINGTLSLPRVLNMAVEKAGELLSVPACALLVAMQDQPTLRLLETRGLPEALTDPGLQNLMAQRAVERKRPTTFYLAPAGERPRVDPENSVDTSPSEAEEDPGLPQIVTALALSGLGGILAVPLIVRRKIVGVLNCFCRTGHHFSSQEIRLIRSFANQAAAALENARLHEIVKDKLHELASLFEVGKAITSTLQLDRVLETITENVQRVMNADATAIMLLDAEHKQLQMKTSINLGRHHTSRSVSLGKGIAGIAAKTGRPMILVDEESGQAATFPEAVRKDGLRTILSVPMAARGHVIGLINVYHKKIHYHEPGEISLLTTLSTQAAIAIENARLYQDKHQVSELLRSILMPREQFEHPHIEVGHRFIPSLELAGDYYEMLPLGNERAAFCIADVSGKGPRAAIYAARAKYILKSYILAGYSPREVLTMLNRLITPETETEMFITLFCAEVDLPNGVLTYSSAGHEPPILLRCARQKIKLLEPRDVVIGLDRDWNYLERRVKIERGDVLVLYTDGVTEARGSGHEGFGLERLQSLVQKFHQLPPQTSADRITSAILKHTRKKLNDDFSLMVVRF